MQNTARKNLEELPHILVIDDDDRIRALVSRYLQENGFVVSTAINVNNARAVMERLVFDALVVDIMMPGESGLDFTKNLRAKNDIPVLLLTALGESDDRITGLETGADDYLGKPFEPRELVLRLKAILRRRPKLSEAQQGFKIGRWIYNPVQNELQDENEGKTLRLTTVEDSLLNALASRAGEVISRNDLAVICDMESGERTIDVQVTRLRRKLGDDARTPRLLQTVRGKGYLLRIEDL